MHTMTVSFRLSFERGDQDRLLDRLASRIASIFNRDEFGVVSISDLQEVLPPNRWAAFDLDEDRLVSELHRTREDAERDAFVCDNAIVIGVHVGTPGRI